MAVIHTIYKLGPSYFGSFQAPILNNSVCLCEVRERESVCVCVYTCMHAMWVCVGGEGGGREREKGSKPIHICLSV